MTLLEKAKQLIARVEQGGISEQQANAMLLVESRKAMTKALSQTEKSNIPLPARMGVAKKGYTRRQSV